MQTLDEYKPKLHLRHVGIEFSPEDETLKKQMLPK
jgi:hypothetical protein